MVIRNKGKRNLGMRVAVLVIAVVLAATANVQAIEKAPLKAKVADTRTITLSTPNMYYGGYQYGLFLIDGSAFSDSKPNIAYCTDPDEKYPVSGTYKLNVENATLSGYTPSGQYKTVTYTSTWSKCTVADQQVWGPGKLLSVGKMLYYSYGQTGFNKVRSAIDEPYRSDDNACAAISHIALSYIKYKGVGKDPELPGNDGWRYMAPQGLINQAYKLMAAADKQGSPHVGWEYFYLAIENGQSVIGSWYQEDKGELALKKKSSANDVTSENDCYTLAGAEFIVKNSKGTEVARFTTDESGNGKTASSASKVVLDAGTYSVTEVKAPKGFILPKEASRTKQVTVTAGEVAQFEFADTPMAYNSGIVLNKIDSITGSSVPQGDGKLAGAVFEVRYYDGFYASEREAKQSGGAIRTWQYETDNKGEINLTNATVLTGSSKEYILGGKKVLPLGTYAIEEVQPPQGYLRDTEIRVVNVKANGEGAGATVEFTAASVPEKAKRGGIEVTKVTDETGKNEPMGGTSFEGIEFSIINRSANSVFVENGLKGSEMLEYKPGEVIMNIVCGADGMARTDKNALPYGRYDVVEVKSDYRQSYLLSDGEAKQVFVAEEGEYATPASDFANEPVRNGLRFIKVGESDDSRNMERLANCVFVLRQNETNEAHVIVTDANGQFSTERWPHSQDTNANDQAVKLDAAGNAVGDVDESQLISKSGVWFGRDRGGNVSEPIDSRGALPYGTYTLTELRCQANRGYELITIKDIKVSEDIKDTDGKKELSYLIDLGTIDDIGIEQKSPEISTTMREDGGAKQVTPARDTRLTDEIRFEGLEVGEEYVFEGALVLKDSNEAIVQQGVPVSGTSKRFVAESANGTTEVEFTLDTTELDGKEIVAYENLYKVKHSSGYAKGSEDPNERLELVAEHRDINSASQTVYVDSGDTPATGDGTRLPIYIGLMLAAAATLVFAYARRRVPR